MFCEVLFLISVQPAAVNALRAEDLSLRSISLEWLTPKVGQNITYQINASCNIIKSVQVGIDHCQGTDSR